MSNETRLSHTIAAVAACVYTSRIETDPHMGDTVCFDIANCDESTAPASIRPDATGTGFTMAHVENGRLLQMHYDGTGYESITAVLEAWQG